jgi:exodeoxyribonuclease V alpha subunit
LLQYKPGEHAFVHCEDNPIKADFIIVDEASMVDTFLAASMFRAMATTSHVLLVGDTDQLPSVGPGNVLGDIINSGKFHVTRLNRIFRQEACSEIISIAHGVINSTAACPAAIQSLGEIDPMGDFHLIEARTAEDCVEKIKTLCKTHLPMWYNVDPVDDVQILVPVHRGAVGTENLNSAFQEMFVPAEYGVDWTPFRIGDKVIQTRNNYEKNIFNGDLGRIIYLNGDEFTATVKFSEGTVQLSRNNLSDMSMAYAISIHKSQGSEFPIVVIALQRQHYIMLQRNLLYTAITRGKNKVFVVGDPDAYAIAIGNRERAERLTGLFRGSVHRNCR